MFKTLLLVLAVATSVPAQERTKILKPAIDSLFPDAPTGHLTDLAGLVKDHSRVNGHLATLRDSLKLNLVAVTLPNTGRFQPDEVALEIGRKWMVALANDTIGAATRNTGGVILIVRDSRQCRIEVATGSEGYLTDSRAADLCRDARQSFRAGDFDSGIIGIANGFAARHVESLNVTQAVSNTNDGNSFAFIFAVIAFLAIVVLVLFNYLNSKWLREADEAAEAEYKRARKEMNARHAAQLKALEEKERAIREQEAVRWNALTPEQQQAEIAAKERLTRKREEERRRKEEEEHRAWEADRPRREAEAARRLQEQDDEDERRRRNNDSYSYDSPSSYSSNDSSSSSSGGSDSFSGGGGGGDW
jgi:uncharacterized membrane protein YgcG